MGGQHGAAAVAQEQVERRVLAEEAQAPWSRRTRASSPTTLVVVSNRPTATEQLSAKPSRADSSCAAATLGRTDRAEGLSTCAFSPFEMGRGGAREGTSL